MIKNIILASHSRHAEIIYFTFRLCFLKETHVYGCPGSIQKDGIHGEREWKVIEYTSKITQ